MRFNFSKIRKSFDLSYVFVSKRSIVGFLSYTPSKMILVMIFINRWERLSTLLSLVASLFFCFKAKIALLILYIITSATVTVTEKLDRELFTTSILFTFFQTVPGRLERDVRWPDTSDFHSPISALVPRPTFMTPSCSTGILQLEIQLDHLTNFGSTVNGTV